VIGAHPAGQPDQQLAWVRAMLLHRDAADSARSAASQIQPMHRATNAAAPHTCRLSSRCPVSEVFSVATGLIASMWLELAAPDACGTGCGWGALHIRQRRTCSWVRHSKAIMMLYSTQKGMSMTLSALHNAVRDVANSMRIACSPSHLPASAIAVDAAMTRCALSTQSLTAEI
jgi:hypothetical protein